MKVVCVYIGATVTQLVGQLSMNPRIDDSIRFLVTRSVPRQDTEPQILGALSAAVCPQQFPQ